MKQYGGVYLPDTEEHFAVALTTDNPGRRIIGDVAAYGYEQLEKAVNRCTHRRVAVDVGAHVGMWSMWLVKEFAHVHAFEPVEEYAEIFAENVPVGNCSIHLIALGEKYGEVSMKLYPEDTGRAHIAGAGNIPVVPLDHFGLQDVDLIKIDVEGYELPVVKGAQATILECRPIVVIEQRGHDVANFGEERDGALYWLTRCLGMRLIEQIHYDFILGW